MPREQRFRQISIATALIGLLGAVTAFGVAPLTEAELPPQQHITELLPLALELPAPVDSFLQTETIRRGDTLAKLLDRMGANDPEFLSFAATDRIGRLALQLRAERNVQVRIDSLGRVESFSYRLGDLEQAAQAGPGTVPQVRLEILRGSDGFRAFRDSIPIERSVEMRSVEIRSSLFAATDGAGIPEGVAIRVAEIFSGELDFTRDLQKGDRLRVVYESIREADSLDAAQAGRVLAVELLNGGQRHSAFWFERDGRGEYFSFDGQSLQKSFLRNPLEFSRITSGFTAARMHPILRDWRAHKGVDFAAPVGTRIRATADGSVEFVGQQRGYGNVVVLNHRNGYSTLYAHMHSFGAQIAQGAKVAQGDMIGTVGTTGWATGPHLHYEVKIDGAQVDPLRVALPDSRPLRTSERKQLAQSVASLRAQLGQIDALRLASFQ